MARTDSEVRELLATVEALRQQKGLTRHQLSDSLGIPFDTFRRWFHEKGAKSPSEVHLQKLQALAGATRKLRPQWEEQWKKIREWWRTQHRYSSLQQLAEEVGWNVDDLRACLQNESKPPRLVVERLAQLLQLQVLPDALSKEAGRRSERLKALLTILAEELAWFRDGPAEARQVYRSEIDPFDTGYVSSLLTMLYAEDKFLRWREVTTTRFNAFKAKRRPR